jgi:hypothetical protein
MQPIAARHDLDLGGWWHAWFDSSAPWQEEPPADPRTPLVALPAHQPTGGWGAEEEGKESARVPGTWEEALPAYHGVAWHWRPLVAPPEWTCDVLRLRFAGVRLRTEVYLNRRLVGYDLDGLTPFEVDVSGLLRPGARYELALRVTNPGGNPPGQAARPVAWAGALLPPGHDFGGVWGQALLIGRPRAYLAEAWVEAPAAGDVRLRCRVINAGPACAARLTAGLVDDETLPIAEAATLDLALPAVGAQEVSLPLPGGGGLEPWTPDSPRLHRVCLRLEGAALADRLVCTFGVRRLGWGSRGYTLNGEPLEVRAALSGGWYPGNLAAPTETLAEQEVRRARALGFNALRVAGHLPPPELLAAADRLGLLVLADPALAAPDPAGGELYAHLAAQRLRRMEALLRGHPAALWATERAAGLALSEVGTAPTGGEAPGAPALPTVPGWTAPLPDVAALLGRYGDRVLPGSDAAAWAERFAALQQSLAERHLGTLFPDVATLARATGRAALDRAADAVALARSADGGPGYLLPAWEDAPRGPLGLLTIHREAKSDGRPLARANEALALAIDGLPRQQAAGAPAVLTVRAANREGLRGGYLLRVRLTSPAGRLLFEEAAWVALSGLPGEELARTPFRASEEGEYVASAQLTRDGSVVAGASRSVWVAETAADLGGARLALLGGDAALSRALTRWGARPRRYRAGRPADALLVTGAAPGGLASILFSGAVQRVAWLAPDPPEPAAWEALLPALGSAAPCAAGPAGGAWLIGGRHPLLDGAGDPGVWWHAEPALLPRYALGSPLPTELITVCALAGQGAPRLATAMGLGHLGEAQLLLCTLPLAEGLAQGLPVAARLLRNIVTWLTAEPRSPLTRR